LLCKYLTRALLFLLLPSFLVGHAKSPDVKEPDNSTSPVIEELQQDVKAAPCKSSERLNAAMALFEKMGAHPEELSIEKPDGIKNVVLKKTGKTNEILVIGAHYDKVMPGCGAVDNWTGIVTLAHLYKALKDEPTTKTILFVAFGDEEEGLFGSKAMVSAIPKAQLGNYCAMINIDSLGMDTPHILLNTSSKKMSAMTVSLGKDLGINVTQRPLHGTDADSSSFVAKKIPAITLDGLTDEWSRTLHTPNDQFEKINMDDFYMGYKLALALAQRVDNSPCDACK